MDEPIVNATMQRLLADLAFGPATAADLEAELGVSNNYVRRLVRRARELRLVRICAWEKRGNQVHAVLALGKHRDAPRPPRTPNAIVRKEYRMRHPERVRKQGQATYWKFREDRISRSKAWRDAHPDQVRHYKQERKNTATDNAAEG